jgi:hypothetical protein
MKYGGRFAAWYRREDYDRFREIMDDGAELPRTFKEWEQAATTQMNIVKQGGVDIQPVLIDPDEFLEYCTERLLSPGKTARLKFAMHKGLEKSRTS